MEYLHAFQNFSQSAMYVIHAGISLLKEQKESSYANALHLSAQVNWAAEDSRPAADPQIEQKRIPQLLQNVLAKKLEPPARPVVCNPFGYGTFALTHCLQGL